MTTTPKDIAFEAMRKALARALKNDIDQYGPIEKFDPYGVGWHTGARAALALADKAMEEKI